MDLEEPVFCIIHNYRRLQPNTQREALAPNEVDWDQLDSIDTAYTDLATWS